MGRLQRRAAAGTYELHASSTGATSDAFVVSEQVYAPILRSAMRMFYHNRVRYREACGLRGQRLGGRS